MGEIGWEQIAKDLSVKGKPESGLWTLAHELVEGACVLKFQAAGEWSYADDGSATCGPDGRSLSHIARSQCINPAGLVGALVGKIGGGTAATEGTVSFVVGRFAVIAVKSEEAGALFLTMNDTLAGLEDNSGELKVQVFVKR